MPFNFPFGVLRNFPLTYNVKIENFFSLELVIPRLKAVMWIKKNNLTESNLFHVRAVINCEQVSLITPVFEYTMR